MLFGQTNIYFREVKNYTVSKQIQQMSTNSNTISL